MYISADCDILMKMQDNIFLPVRAWEYVLSALVCVSICDHDN